MCAGGRLLHVALHLVRLWSACVPWSSRVAVSAAAAAAAACHRLRTLRLRACWSPAQHQRLPLTSSSAQHRCEAGAAGGHAGGRQQQPMSAAGADSKPAAGGSAEAGSGTCRPQRPECCGAVNSRSLIRNDSASAVLVTIGPGLAAAATAVPFSRRGRHAQAAQLVDMGWLTAHTCVCSLCSSGTLQCTLTTSPPKHTRSLTFFTHFLKTTRHPTQASHQHTRLRLLCCRWARLRSSGCWPSGTQTWRRRTAYGGDGP